VTIQSLSVTADNYGEPVQTWTNGASVWAEVTPNMTGTREAFAAQAGQRTATASMQVRMRYKSGLTPKSTRLLLADGEVFEVEAVLDPDGRKRETLLIGYIQG
jgi:SPP1 family predicted phage head-tail adaptor